jgi:DNA (cytosine-5)-methyltransferase 1
VRVLDLFCGAGGTAMGYHNAGLDVVGIDIAPQPHYPFEFHQGNVFDWLDGGMIDWFGFDAIHASPPCQDHMRTPHRPHGTKWMLDAVRQRLITQPKPWVIENVPGADMRPDFVICGCQVGLDLRRVRLFETSFGRGGGLPPHNHPYPVLCVTGSGTPTWVLRKWRERFSTNPTIADYRRAMGIDWMNRQELSQAVPPAYTEHVGGFLLAHLETTRNRRALMDRMTQKKTTPVHRGPGPKSQRNVNNDNEANRAKSR